MNIDWKKIINKQSYSECQIVTALNAHYYLYDKQYCEYKDKIYEELVDLTGARHGSAIGIKKVWKKLEIKPTNTFSNTTDLLCRQYSTIEELENDYKTERIPLPLEICVWHRKTGYHSALVVDFNSEIKVFRIANFPQETSSEGWIFIEELYKFIKVYPNPNLDYCYRLFEKIE